MANQQFSRNSGKGKMLYTGMNVRVPPDLMPPGRTPFLLNVTPDEKTGAIQSRAGLTQLAAPLAANPIHTFTRINDQLPGAAATYARFAGLGTVLFYAAGAGAFAQIDTGFSGNPLSVVPYRPPQSPETWLYVYDSVKQRKYRVDGTIRNVGILPPPLEPTTALSQPNLVSVVNVSSTTGWTGSGGAANPTIVQRVAAATTVAAILYDTGSTGWCTIQPTNASGNYDGLGFGAGVAIAAPVSVVQQNFPALSSTTVAAFLYDSGSSGNVRIVPTAPVQGLQRNALVLINGVATRVLSVTAGSDGTYSFYCNMGAGVGNGQTITIPFSFRVYTTGTASVGQAITSQLFQSVMTGGDGAGGSTVALVANTSITPLDLTQNNGRAITDEDYMHVSVQFDHPENVLEVHFLLDVDATTNDFNHNYYYYVVRQNDFQNVSQGGATSTTGLLQALTSGIAQQLDVSQEGFNPTGLPYPSPSLSKSGVPAGDQLAIGASQLFEATFRINDLQRIGGDQSVNLSKVKAVGVMAVLTGNANLLFGAWWVEGSYGPDTNWNSYGNQGQPIIYRYRYRSSVTGAVSDVSPATRSGELPLRGGVNVTVVQSSDTQADLIDIERNGGTFDTWHRCLTVPNTSGAYLDSVRETVALASDPLELLQYTPWPITDKPRSSTVNITGTRVVRTAGDTFNVNWIRGVEVIVNNQTYTLHAPPSSTTVLELEQHVGNFTGVTMLIPEATIIGQPLPYVCLGLDGRMFATGDPFNPGILYFSNPYNPDTASDQGYIEITGPSEPLGPPVYYEGALYVFSNTSVYRVESTPGQTNPYAAYKLGGVVGLAAPWAIDAKGPLLVYLGPYGIVALSPGGQATNLTEDDLYPIFPFESRPGVPVTVVRFTVYPPDYTRQTSLRISFADGFYFFDHLDTAGNYSCLVYRLATKGWLLYRYVPGVTLHYFEEGTPNPLTFALGLDGSVNYLSSALTDAGNAIPSVVIVPADDQGETRARKQYGDFMLDYSLQSSQYLS